MYVNSFEYAYRELVSDVLYTGSLRETRNGETRSVFGKTIQFGNLASQLFPILVGRKYSYAGVLGEFAAFIRGPKHIDDFKKFGCNYWDMWAADDGSINVDYGNEWLANDQVTNVLKSLREDPHGRRHLITGWRPENLADLSLPCCHYAYQFYVRTDYAGHKHIDMLWHQRSTDVMLGLPADAILASLWVILIAKETGYLPGRVTMTLGDTHIYEDHYVAAKQYLHQSAPQNLDRALIQPTYRLSEDATLLGFVPDMLTIDDYFPQPAIKMELIK